MQVEETKHTGTDPVDIVILRVLPFINSFSLVYQCVIKRSDDELFGLIPSQAHVDRCNSPQILMLLK